MKKKLLTLSLSVVSVMGFSQLYSDSFNDQINKVSSTTGLSTSESGDALHITGDGTSAAWTPIVYSFNSSGTDANVNVSSNSKLYVKVKSSVAAQLRFDLRDADGYTTNYTPSVINVGTDYQIFEIDFSTKLKDGGYGGPCASTSAPCNVDATKLKYMLIYVNASTGAFNGTVDVEWISFGTSLVSAFDIRYNQVGYFTQKTKYINVFSSENFAPQSFTVLDSSNKTVLSGTTGTSFQWKTGAGELLLNSYSAVADVTLVKTPGTYKFKVGDSDISFKVGDDVYKTLSDDVLHYYYLARCSTDITPEYGGIYARKMGIDDSNVVVAENAAIPGNAEYEKNDTIGPKLKGWYDAADYNKYVVNSGIATYTLLAAYERYKDLYKAKSLNIPEKGGDLPDVLDEAKWNIDWMYSMRAPDGSVFHKLSGQRFAPQVMPEMYHAKLADLNLDNRRFVLGRTTAAALNFAAVLATASRLYKEFDPVTSQDWLDAAKRAFNWASANPDVYYANPNEVAPTGTTQKDPAGFETGTYNDTGDMSQEFTWAAVELFLATQDDSYLYDSHVNVPILTSNKNVATWSNPGPLALFSINMNKDIAATSSKLGDISQYTQRIIDLANGHKYLASKSPMKYSIGDGLWDFYWGSTSNAAKYSMYLITAYEETKNTDYLDLAYLEMDYLMGRNGTGYSYITGHGDNPSKLPHHRPSTSDGIDAPWPGMLVGGPNTNHKKDLNGNVIVNGDLLSCFNYYTDNYPANRYVDDTCSYSANEVAINWNAPLAFVVNALQNYVTPEQTLDTTDESVKEIIKKEVIAYPNPTTGIVNIKASKDLKIKNVSTYNAAGQLVKSSTSNTLDLSSQPAGVYFLRIVTDNDEVFNQKVIKK